MISEEKYSDYIKILNEELLPAMGCTEPIAIAYGAAKAREVLGRMPESVCLEVSGNIIKNVKSVVVPNTGFLHGIPAAAAAGIVAGKADKLLEVISEVSEEERKAIIDFLESVPISVSCIDNGAVFDIVITLRAGNDYVKLRIADFHTNIVLIEKNSEVLLSVARKNESKEQLTDRSCLNVEDIIEFAQTCNFDDVRELIERQIEYNWNISQEGLNGNWGANVGSVLMKISNDARTEAMAVAAAGSDARMSGCELPVVIVSGSGNQGIASSVPVIVYARRLGVSDDKMKRAVLLSDLLTIHVKTGIGRLSAYCGAVIAGCCSGAAIAWLYGEKYEGIAHTLVNSLAVVSGIVCDGAKPSCAAKISTSVEAGILGYEMYRNGQQFYGGDGLVTKGVENTIKNIGRLGHEGMKETDKVILNIMTSLK